MLEWISIHSETINTFASVSMLLVWIAYLQVFLRSYRRQVRPKIVINRAAGSALNASCFVGNMSSESIYIESVVVKLTCRDWDISHTVTDREELEGDEHAEDPRQRTLQGPFRPGDYTSIGTFDDLIEKVRCSKGNADNNPKDAGEPIALEVLVIADYSSDDLLIGAKRTFEAESRGEEWFVRAKTAETTQIRSRQERRWIKGMLAE